MSFMQAESALQRLQEATVQHVQAITRLKNTFMDDVLTPTQLARIHAACAPHLPVIASMIDLIVSRSTQADAHSSKVAGECRQALGHSCILLMPAIAHTTSSDMYIKYNKICMVHARDCCYGFWGTTYSDVDGNPAGCQRWCFIPVLWGVHPFPACMALTYATVFMNWPDPAHPPEVTQTALAIQL